MKKLLVVLFSAVAAFSTAGAFAATDTATATTTATTMPASSFRVGVVDVRTVLQKSPQMAVMQKKLQSEFGSREKDIKTAQQQLQADSDKMSRDSSVMSAADRTALQTKIQTETQSLRTMQMSFQKDVYSKQNDAMQTLLGQLQGVIASIAKANNLSLVITKDAIAYASNDVDITDQVIREMGKK